MTPKINKYALLLLLLPILVGPLSGCAWLRTTVFGSAEEEDFYIPAQETAYDQLLYAEALRQSTFASTNRERRAQQMEKIIEAYEKVVELFPEDQVSTPKAKTNLGMLFARTPHRKEEAMRYLKEVERKHGDMSWVLVRSLYNQALLYDQAGRYDEAQSKYREVVDRFRTSSDPTEQDFARRARDRYNRVRPR